MAIAKINLTYQIDGLGDRVKADIAMIVSGIVMRTEGYGFISTTSAAINFQGLHSAYGIYMHCLSCTSTNQLYIMMSGLAQSAGMRLPNGQGSYFQYYNRQAHPHVYSEKACNYYFALFGK